MHLGVNTEVCTKDIRFTKYWRFTKSRVGISETTAKSQRKFVPSSHPGPFAEVASSMKSQTKVNVGTLACFDFL